MNMKRSRNCINKQQEKTLVEGSASEVAAVFKELARRTSSFTTGDATSLCNALQRYLLPNQLKSLEAEEVSSILNNFGKLLNKDEKFVHTYLEVCNSISIFASMIEIYAILLGKQKTCVSNDDFEVFPQDFSSAINANVHRLLIFIILGKILTIAIIRLNKYFYTR